MFITKGPATALGIARHAIDTLIGTTAENRRGAARSASASRRPRCFATMSTYKTQSGGQRLPCLGAHPCVRVVGDLWASLLDGRRQPTERQLALFTTYIRTRLEFAATWCSSSARRQAVERSIKRDRAIAACTTS